jgi:excisionase family DNA binding protein
MMRDDKVLYTLEEVRAVLACSKWKVYAYVKDGKLDMVKLGRVSRITDESLRKLVRELPKAEMRTL